MLLHETLQHLFCFLKAIKLLLWKPLCVVSVGRSGQPWRNRHRSHVQKHVLDRLHTGPHRGVPTGRQPAARRLRQWPHQPATDRRWPRLRVRVCLVTPLWRKHTHTLCSRVTYMTHVSLSILQIPVLVRLEPRRAQDRALRFGRQRQDGAGARRAGAAQCSDLWPPEQAALLGGRRSASHSFSNISHDSYLVIIIDIFFLYNNITDESFTIRPEARLFCWTA